jgi:hypothetical protein
MLTFQGIRNFFVRVKRKTTNDGRGQEAWKSVLIPVSREKSMSKIVNMTFKMNCQIRGFAFWDSEMRVYFCNWTVLTHDSNNSIGSMLIYFTF